MKMLIRFFAVAALVVSVSMASNADGESAAWWCGADTDTHAIRWTQTNLGMQKAGVTLPKEGEIPETLIVFLHGDAPSNNPTYQYRLAAAIAARWSNAIGAGILRPGYKDGCGKGSDGEAGYKTGDNYTAEVVTSLASTIQALKDEFRPKETIVVGHSGGAALTGLLATRYGDLQDRNVMFSCPCDLPKWRAVMRNLTGKSIWANDMGGLSVIDEVDSIPENLEIHMYVGGADKVTPPFLSKDFMAAAKAAGKTVSLTITSEDDHENILRPANLTKLVETLKR